MMRYITIISTVSTLGLSAHAADFTQACQIKLHAEPAQETEVWKGTLSRSAPHSQGLGAFSLDLALSSDFQIEARLIDDKYIDVATLSTEGSIPAAIRWGIRGEFRGKSYTALTLDCRPN